MATSTYNGRYFIQSNLGKNGNFEVIVPISHSKVTHGIFYLAPFYRDNDVTNFDTAWHQGNVGNPIGQTGVIGSPALIQSSFGTGNQGKPIVVDIAFGPLP